MVLSNLNITSSSSMLSTILSLLSSIKVWDMAKKGLPNEIKNNNVGRQYKFVSLYQYIIDDSLECLVNLLAGWKAILVGFGSPYLSFLKILYDVTFILAPKSARALSSTKLLITQLISKLPTSFNFLGSLFKGMAEHSSLNITEQFLELPVVGKPFKICCTLTFETVLLQKEG